VDFRRKPKLKLLLMTRLLIAPLKQLKTRRVPARSVTARFSCMTCNRSSVSVPVKPATMHCDRQGDNKMKKIIQKVLCATALLGTGDACACTGCRFQTGRNRSAGCRQRQRCSAGQRTSTVAAAPAASSEAAPAAPAAAAPVPNKGDTAWMMVATLLVILMTIPGLALFYGGLVRSKNMLSILMQVFMIFAVIIVLWCLYGYSLAFTEGSAFIGSFDRVMLKGIWDPVSLRNRCHLQQRRGDSGICVRGIPGDFRCNYLRSDRRCICRTCASRQYWHSWCCGSPSVICRLHTWSGSGLA
jgi:uncharacterized protein with PQ loop repeat